MLILLETILYFLVFMIGACIFSFLNVVICRLPRGEDFVKGHSHCPSCGHRLYMKDMVPVFSILFLGGKCRYCKGKIPCADTLREIIGGALAVGTVLWFGFTAKIIIVFAFCAVLWCVAWIDAKTMEISNGFIIAMLVIGVAAIFLIPEVTIIERLIGVVCTSVPLLILTLIIPGAFGGGDLKLLAATGLVLGWKNACLALFIGILGGGFYGIYLLATKKKGRKEHFAFGPFLCAGMGCAIYFGENIINWYLGFFGI